MVNFVKSLKKLANLDKFGNIFCTASIEKWKYLIKGVKNDKILLKV